VRSKGSQPAKKPTSRKTTPKPKASKKTSKAKTSSKKTPAGKSSAPSSRARVSAKTSAPEVAAPITDFKPLGHRTGAGRPIDTPDIWTKDHLAEVVDWIHDYTDHVGLPSVAEFCYLYGVRHQRFSEFPELAEAREYLQSKRAFVIDRDALLTTKETGCRVAYYGRMSANVGPFSLTEKTETTARIEGVNVYLPDNGRGDGLPPKGSADA
jgi:hypothetical protein